MRQLHILYTHRFYEPKQLLRLCDLNVDSFMLCLLLFSILVETVLFCFLFSFMFLGLLEDRRPVSSSWFSLSFFLFVFFFLFSCSLLCSSLLSLIIVFVSLAAFVVNVSCICFVWIFLVSLFCCSLSMSICSASAPTYLFTK